MIFYLLIKVYWDKIINELIGLWFIQLSRSSMIITVPFFAIAFLLLGMHQSSPTEYPSDWSPSPSEVPSPTGYLRRTGYLWRTGTQSDWVTSHDWNWCISTSRVFETRIFLSSNFKKMRKYRFYWWSYFVYLFMIEVLNDFGLLKRIYVLWCKGDPVTQSGTGTGASLVVNVYRYFLIVFSGVREKVNSAFVRARRVLSWSPFCSNPDWRYPTSHVSTFFNESIPSTTEQSRKINGQASTMTYTSNSIDYSFTDSLVFIHRNELT